MKGTDMDRTDLETLDRTGRERALARCRALAAQIEAALGNNPGLRSTQALAEFYAALDQAAAILNKAGQGTEPGPGK
ncbi:MAG TPA: hypothetical protein VIH54_16315 [Chthoniobacterales bacterium]|jgi:hypothetical protein